jgi:hypothetical protein
MEISGGNTSALMRGYLDDFLLLLILIVALSANCTRPVEARVEKIEGSMQRVLPDRMQSLTGVRDGDVLKARLAFASDGSELVMDMLFRIGVPTRLETGRYRWQRKEGTIEGPVEAESVTFLGGQSDGPSLGGDFLLLSSNGVRLYKVIVPTTIVSKPSQKGARP